MTKDQREIQRKLRILRYAEDTGHVAKTCRYSGIGRTNFYRWRKDCAERGETELIDAPPIPKRHANRTPVPLEGKVPYQMRLLVASLEPIQPCLDPKLKTAKLWTLCLRP
jgi:hypothetical protein